MLNDKVKLLRPYQKKDAFFIAQKFACGVFNEQRTGKTPTTLIGLRTKKCKKILIVCPASMLIPWKNEFEKWYEAPCEICVGTPDKRKEIVYNKWTDGLVISYDLLKDTKTRHGVIHQILDQQFDAIVLDEAHKIKDRNSKTTQAVWLLKNKCQHKVALTGTPAPNYPYDVWPILHFLFPKYFRSYWKFIEEFFVVEERINHSTNTKYKNIGTFKSRRKERELQELLDKIAISRKRKDVMPWLPPKTYTDILLTPSKTQSDCLYHLQEYFEIPNTDIVCQGLLDRLTRYRQVCVAPVLINKDHKRVLEQSPKLQWIKQYISDYPNRPTIIFTKFTSIIKYITPLFEAHKCAVIDGTTTLKTRAEIIQDFQDGCINYLIANIDTCKEGITLDRAETTIFLDEYPPGATIEQAEDRFVSTKESKIKVNNHIIRLIMKGTYEEHIRELIKDHKNETDIVNNFKQFSA